MKTRSPLLAAASLAVIWLGGCTSDPATHVRNDEASDASRTAGLSSSGHHRNAAEEARALEIRHLADNSLVYFDFDRDTIAPQFRQQLDAHAKYLAANPAAAVRLEGHADERGTREYNLALGERRALAVRRELVLRGVPATQFQVISYGEEQPAVTGRGEASYAANRRVMLRYTNTPVAQAQQETNARRLAALGPELLND